MIDVDDANKDAKDASVERRAPAGGLHAFKPRRRSVDFARTIYRSYPGRIGGGVMLVIILLAVIAPLIAPYSADGQQIAVRLQSPSLQHFFGTDELGRDIFSRILYGSRISLTVGIVAVAIALAIGVTVGLVAGFYGGVVDMLLMRIVDIMLAFPGFLLALAIIAMLGPSLRNAMIAVGIGSSTGFARLVRGSVLSIKENDYVMAAHVIGAPNARIMRTHVLPNALTPIIVLATLELPATILIAAGLSFLGLGAQPPSPEWGAMLVDGRSYIQTAWWLITFPGIAIFVTVLGFNLFGNALQDAL
ncbi:MAG TPA: nickel transporter permease, partial [Thermomicrobiaceae bacterium]|nr:nickel transporter permease [Thermomicrobiaceae bacterium]